MSTAVYSFTGIRSRAIGLTRYLTPLIITLLLILAAAILLVRMAFPGNPAFHYGYLADNFLHGSFAVDNLPASYQDKLSYNGHTYLPLGPLPAVLLMPAVALLGPQVDGIYVGLLLALASAWLLNGVLARAGISDSGRRRWLLLLFFCGTIYLSILVHGNSWFLAHLLVMTCLLLAIYESLGARRSWLIGAAVGAAFLTRVTAVFGGIYFLYVFWREQRLNVRTVAGLALGFAPWLAFFLWYNYARFGNPLETGYAHAVLGGRTLDLALSYGLFSPAHIPKNLYMLLLATPQPVPGWDAPVLQFPYILPSPWGMGIFFTTPAFLYAFRNRLGDKCVVGAWLAVALVLVPLLLYYGIGWIQFGYRYATDFYPFLFLLTALAIDRHFSWVARGAIVVSVLINLWGAYTGYFLFLIR